MLRVLIKNLSPSLLSTLNRQTLFLCMCFMLPFSHKVFFSLSPFSPLHILFSPHLSLSIRSETCLDYYISAQNQLTVSQQTQNMSAPSSSSASSVWLISYTKLQFFSRIRRFLQSKSARKRQAESSSSHSNLDFSRASRSHDAEEVQQVVEKQQQQREEDDSVVLQKSVKRLHFGSWEEKEMAAMEIERLAKADAKIKKLMAELGVIQMLVSMVATEVVGRRRAAVKALIELANGTYT